MKLKFIFLCCCTTFSLHASTLEFFHSEVDRLSLESEIEALLEDQEFDPPAKEANIPIANKTPIRQTPVERDLPVSHLIDPDLATLDPSDHLSVVAPLQESISKSIDTIQISLREVFKGSPLIYSVLLLLSMSALSIWLYSILTMRSIEFLPPKLVRDLRSKLIGNQFNEVLDICVTEKHFFCKMLASGILARKHGPTIMLDAMKSEGKRGTVGFWQRIALLNDIAIIAPMLGLLGTVMGMFYAFYDLNRSIESVSVLFDGLGISVGTTVAGLFVAILAMILHSLAKYRLVRVLATVENEAQTFAALIENREPLVEHKR